MVATAGSAKNLVRALALLKLLSGNPGGMSLAEVSRVGALPKPTAHRLLSVLAEAGMVRETGSGGYGLGPECLVLGSAFLDGLDLRREAREILEALVERTGETCHLGIRDGDRVVYVEKVESPQMVQLRSRIGLIAPLHTTALGKVLLAYGEEAEVEALFAAGLEKRTANTITDLDEFRVRLDLIRESGFAVDDVENEEGIRCVAAPVFDHDGKVVASISVSGPEYRVPSDRLEDLGKEVSDAALTLSRRIGYHRDIYNPGEESRRRRIPSSKTALDLRNN